MANKIKGITIEIAGDTTKLGKALGDVDSRAKKTTAELKEIQKALKFDPKNPELLAQKMRVLGKSVDETREKLATLKKAQEQASQKLAKGELSTEEYEALRREILKTERQLASLEGEVNKSSKTWAKHADTLNKVGKGFTTAGEKLGKVGKGMSAAVTAPIVGIGVAAGKAFSEVDSGFDTIVAKTGATGKELEGLNKVFESTYTSFPATAQEVGNAIGDINTAFSSNGKTLEEHTRLFLEFAKVNSVDVTSAVNGAKGVITQYGLSLSELPAVLDAVNVTGQKTGTDVARLMEIMAQNATVARDLKLPFGEMALLMGKIDQSGLDVNRTLSYLSRAQAQSAKEGKTLSQSLEEFSEMAHSSASETAQLEAATRLFGAKGGGQMLSAVKSGALNLKNLRAEMAGTAGSVAKTFEATADPIDKMQSALNAVKLAGADLFGVVQEIAVPLIQRLADGAKSLVTWWRGLDKTTQNLIVKITAFTATIGPVLVLIGKITSGIGALISKMGPVLAFLASNPIVLAIVAIASAVGGLVYLVIHNWETIKATIASAGDWIIQKWAGVKGFFAGLWGGIKEQAAYAWQGIKEHASNAWQGVTTVWSSASGWFSNLFSNISIVASNAWQTISAGVGVVYNAITGAFGSAISWVTDQISSLVNWVSNAWQSITNFVSDFGNKVSSVFSRGGTTTARPSGYGPVSSGAGLSWYDRGGVFTRPAVIGVGEKRPEFVGALDDLRRIVREESGRGITVNVNGAILREEQDIREVGRQLAREIARYV